jgi:ribonuclease D
LTGASVDKGARFTDWSIRPLNRRQIDYALADVVFLKPAYLKLCKLLEDGGRTDWIEGEMETLLDESIYDVDPMLVFKRIKARNAKPRTLAVLRALAAWREQQARKRDLTRNRILRDEALMEIAHHTPRDVEGVARIRGMGRRMAEGQSGQEILQAVKCGLDVADKDCPQPRSRPVLPRGIGPTSDLLKVLLKIKCEEFNVAQKLIASSDDIDLIAAYGEKADVRALNNWRYDVFGRDALLIRDGKCGIAMKGKSLILIEL